MKRWVVFLFVIFLTNSFSQTSISPQFSELKGMEDQQGNTHLFYRIYTSFENPPIYSWSNHIYHWDLQTGIDSLFISASGHEDPLYNFNKWVSDVDYWNNNPAEFIYSGGATTGQFYEGNAYITRFDGYTNNFGSFWGSANYIDISALDDSLLYAGIYTDGGPGLLKSSNGGRSWDSLSAVYKFLSLCPSNENIYFVENQDKELFRTTDGGNTFNLVDSEFVVDSRYYYDSDGQHIYRKTSDKLIVTDNLGEQFSWQLKYETQNPFYLSLDESISGTIYLADKKNILVSTDYGNTFTLYKSLERKIVGIYKKPNSNKLYAATKYKIYEITSDTIQVVKSLPIPEEAFGWLPMGLGNKWIYLNTFYGDVGDSIRWFTITEVVGYKIIDDKVFNKLLVREIPIDPSGNSGTREEFFRVDSSFGKVYQAGIENDSLLFENLYMDLLAEVGDTIPVGNGIYLASEEPVSIFDLDSKKRTFYHTQTPVQEIQLVNGLGLFYEYMWELVGIKQVILGCIIDGVIYGDTTTVDVEEETPVASECKLEQNYPNPFNPSTKIKYQIPSVGTQRVVSVQLKVYDVLGNEVATLVNEEKPAGEYEVEFNPESSIKYPASGIYFYQLRAGNFIQSKKMVYLK